MTGRLGREVLELLHVGVEGHVVPARLDVADDLALRGLAGAVEPLERRLELGGDRDHRAHGAAGDHLERADGVGVGRVGHRERELGLVLAHRERPRFAQEPRGHALFEDRKFGIARRIEERQLELGCETLRRHRAGTRYPA